MTAEGLASGQPTALPDTKKPATSKLYLTARLTFVKQGRCNETYSIGQQRPQSMPQLLSKSRRNSHQKIASCCCLKQSSQPIKYEGLDAEKAGLFPRAKRRATVYRHPYASAPHEAIC